MKKFRLKPDVRKQQILDAAIKYAVDNHMLMLTIPRVAAIVGITPSAVSYYFTIKRLISAVMAHGRRVGDARITVAAKHLKARDKI